MWRAFFLAIGFFMLMVGAQLLLVDKAFLRIHNDAPTTIFDRSPKVTPVTVVPKPWWSWSLIGTGAVVCIYSFTLRRNPQQ